MSNFWTLVGFEYKKIFARKSVWVTLLLAVLVTIFNCCAMVMGNVSQGSAYPAELTAYEAMLMDKSDEKALEGRPLDGALIMEAAAAYQRIEGNAARYTASEGYQRYARPYSSVFTLIDAAYSRPDRAFDVWEFQNISQQAADDYYTIRLEQYRTNISGNPMWSAANVARVMALDEAVQKPFVMQYKDGYQRFFSLSVTTMGALLFVISFAVSPIFSDEYSKGTDSLILAAKNGKNVFIQAKLFTATSFSFVVTLLFVMSAYLSCMAVYGFDGAAAQIQLLIPAITYSFTMLDVVVILTVASLFGAFLHTGLCVLISSLCQSSIIPMSITTVLIVAGLFNGISHPLFARLRVFLPAAMGSFDDLITQLSWNILGVELWTYQAVCVVAAVVGSLLLLLAQRSFRRHQVV